MQDLGRHQRTDRFTNNLHSLYAGQCLPDMEELVMMKWRSRAYMNSVVHGLDWAAYLPRGLRRLEMGSVELDHSLLQHLIKVPSLTHLELAGLELRGNQTEEYPPIDSAGCAWKTVKLRYVPSVPLVQSFSSWPLLDKLELCHPRFFFHWPSSEEKRTDIDSAMFKLASCMSLEVKGMLRLCPLDDLQTDGDGQPDGGTMAAVLSAMQPLLERCSNISLWSWHITAQLLNDLSDRAPGLTALAFTDCISIEGKVWQSLLKLPQICRLHLSQFHSNPISASSIALLISFLSMVPHEMSVELELMNCNSPRDGEVLNAFAAYVHELRASMGWPRVYLTMKLY